jgi:hypothetical protein
MKINEQRLRKKVALIKTEYEEGRLQSTQAGHPQLATPTTLYWLRYWKFMYNYMWVLFCSNPDVIGIVHGFSMSQKLTRGFFISNIFPTQILYKRHS